MINTGLVVRVWNDAAIARRDEDGFANATAMCQANGKLFGDYQRLERTQQYVAALAAELQLPAEQLIQSITTGPNEFRGTWIHPRLAVDLARWISPEFAVWMDGWFLEQLHQPQAPNLTAEDVVRIAQQVASTMQPRPSRRRVNRYPELPQYEHTESTKHAIVTVLAEAHSSGRDRIRTSLLVNEVAQRFGRAPRSVHNTIAMLQRERVVLRPRRGLVCLCKPPALAITTAISPLQPAAPGTVSGRLVLMDIIYRLAVAAGRAIGWKDICSHLTPEQRRAIGLQQAVEAMEALQALEAGYITTDNGIAFNAGKDIALLPWLTA